MKNPIEAKNMIKPNIGSDSAKDKDNSRQYARAAPFSENIKERY